MSCNPSDKFVTSFIIYEINEKTLIAIVVSFIKPQIFTL